ncbi:MAG: RpiB/LacA/LacB family sugar-phosphate isomerase [Pseudomonadota bacterium]|nr:RpiB/LacA/LacB family sugar-phosphate isomerase [Pseudomonadota bacterium]
MPIGIASDHAGLQLKALLIRSLADVSFHDFGANTDASVDYPDYASKLALAVSQGQLAGGVAICATGIGMAIVANKFPAVRAAVCWSEKTCQLAKEHNDANILCLGAQHVRHEDSVRWVQTWLAAKFSDADRHARRVQKIATLEQSLGICTTKLTNKELL